MHPSVRDAGAADLQATDEEYVVEVALEGVDRDQIDVCHVSAEYADGYSRFESRLAAKAGTTSK
jgi:hypothetical protein